MASALLAISVLAACGGAHPPAPGARPGSPQPATSAAAATHLTVTSAPWRLPEPLSRMVVLARPGGLLVLGGLDSAGSSVATVVGIDPARGRVASMGSLVRPTHDAGGALLGGVAYVFGGGEAVSVAGVQAFSPGKASRLAGRLPRARSDLTAVTSGGKALLAGGYDGAQAALGVLATTDGTTFRVVARLAQPVRYAAAAVAGGALYVFGGEWDGRPTAAIQRVDLATGSVTLAGRLPVPVSHACAFTLGGAIWVAGGRTGAGPVAAITRFDVSTAAAVPAGRLPLPVADPGAAVLGGVAYVVGGEGPGALTASAAELRPA